MYRLFKNTLLLLIIVTGVFLFLAAPARADTDISVTISDPDHPGRPQSQGNTVYSVTAAPVVKAGENQMLGTVQVTGREGIKVPVGPGARIKISLPPGICYMREPNADNYRQYVRWPDTYNGLKNQIRDSKDVPGMIFDCATPHSMILKVGNVDETADTMLIEFIFDKENYSSVRIAPFIAHAADLLAEPEGKMTRLEFFKLFAQVAPPWYVNHSKPAQKTMEERFSDLGSMSPLDKELIRGLVDSWLVRGYKDGTLGPEKYITRGEAVAIAGRGYGRLGTRAGYRDIIPSWGDAAITCAATARLIPDYFTGLFHGNDFLNRANALSLLQNCLERQTIEGPVPQYAVGQSIGY